MKEALEVKTSMNDDRKGPLPILTTYVENLIQRLSSTTLLRHRFPVSTTTNIDNISETRNPIHDLRQLL